MVPELARGGGAGHDLELGAIVGAVVGEREAVVWPSAYAHAESSLDGEYTH